MTIGCRTYTQAQVNRIFADAEASAIQRGTTNWDAYILGFVATRLGVVLNVPESVSQ